nr:type 1 fimbrial protein [Dyella sp. ASV24]
MSSKTENRLMKTFLALCVAVAALIGAPVAQSQTTSFDITGEVTPTPCNITVPDVDLGTFTTASFTGNTTTPWVQVIVYGTQCDPRSLLVRLNFSGPSDAADASLFLGTVGAGIQVTGPDQQQPILPSGSQVVAYPIGDASFTSTLFARFKQSAPGVTASTVRTPITLQIAYN